LGFARKNLVFGQRANRSKTAKMVLNQGQDPFRREPVIAVVRLLDICKMLPAIGKMLPSPSRSNAQT
jgi:hypothetical protein